MKNEEWLNKAASVLKTADIGSARLDSLILLEDELGRDRTWILAHPEEELKPEQVRKLNKKIVRRAEHEPLAYIRGFTEFYGRKFKVNKQVLEPRPESETMIELLKQLVNRLQVTGYSKASQSQGLDAMQGAGEQQTEPYMKYAEGAVQSATQQSAKSASGAASFAGRQAGAALSIADVGTGSGALGITAKLEMSELEVDLYDIDASCLAVARHNALMHELHLHCYKRDLLNRPVHAYDILLANLPYVPSRWKINKAAAMEPRLAIFGGKDGLDVYRRLFEQINGLPWRPEYIFTESLPPQHDKLAKIAAKTGYKPQKTSDFIQVFHK